MVNHSQLYEGTKTYARIQIHKKSKLIVHFSSMKDVLRKYALKQCDCCYRPP